MKKINPVHKFTLDFRVPGPKRSQPYLTMCIPIVIFSFSDTYEYAKKSGEFIHSFLDTEDYRITMTLKAAPIFDHIYTHL